VRVTSGAGDPHVVLSVSVAIRKSGNLTGDRFPDGFGVAP
jgi:hypothetical protein